MNISIIIPTHQYSKKLQQCLKSVACVVQQVPCEVIVVLDGIEVNQIFFEQFQITNLNIVPLTKNQGPAMARNCGVKVATGRIMFFIDADVTISSEAIQRIKTHFSTNTTKVLIGSYDDDPIEQAIISKYRNLLHHYTHQEASEKATTFWGACGAIDKNLFDEIGGFDISFTQPCIEDIKLGYSLVQKNYAIKLDKHLQVKHLKKWTLFNMIYTDIFLRAKPWTKIIYQYKNWNVKDLNIRQDEKLAVTSLYLGIFCIITSFLYPYLLLTSIFFWGFLFHLKRNTYTFFTKHFKFYQMPIVILLHWLYLLCAGIGFILGTIEQKI